MILFRGFDFFQRNVENINGTEKYHFRSDKVFLFKHQVNFKHYYYYHFKEVRRRKAIFLMWINQAVDLFHRYGNFLKPQT